MLAILIGILILVVQEAVSSAPERISSVVIKNTNGISSCPSDDLLVSAKGDVTNEILRLLGGWVEVVNLDMTNSSQSCPSPWTEISSPSRLCVSSSCSSSAIFRVPNRPYSHVRGRVTGFGTGGLDAFFQKDTSIMYTIDIGYLDGVSITHGSSPRKHIWSFAAGHLSGNTEYRHCPCDATVNTTFSPAPFPPSFVGNNYFCDGAYNGFLWNGQDCVTDCCTFNRPPWFTVTLPSPTEDDIEVRICTDESTSDERIYVQQIQLFVK